jgi:hypothetical protein
MRVRCLFGLAALACAAGTANALTFECRWVERSGTVDTPIAGGSITVVPGSSHRFRLQFRVLDDGSAAGGFVGWNVGTLDVSGAAANSQTRRTNGRVPPYVFAGQPTANGNPPPAGGVNTGDAAGVDIDHLTEVDATLGTQSPAWGCDAGGQPLPPPPALVRGLSSQANGGWQSVFEVTDVSSLSAVNYSITAGGNLIAATEWRLVGTPIEPDCETGTPGSITYAPFPTAPTPFQCVLNIVVPAPGAAALLGLGGLLVARRRR